METETRREPRLFRTPEDRALARLEHQTASRQREGERSRVPREGRRSRTIQPVSDDIPQVQDQSGNCAAPGCTNPGGAFTLERDGQMYQFCSEACRAAFERSANDGIFMAEPVAVVRRQ
jgi:YHS domain-containing protein